MELKTRGFDSRGMNCLRVSAGAILMMISPQYGIVGVRVGEGQYVYVMDRKAGNCGHVIRPRLTLLPHRILNH